MCTVPYRTPSARAPVQFKRMLKKELSQFAGASGSAGSQIAEYISTTYTGARSPSHAFHSLLFYSLRLISPSSRTLSRLLELETRRRLSSDRPTVHYVWMERHADTVHYLHL